MVIAVNNLKKKSLDEVQLARAFAIFAVLIVHSSSSGVTTIEHDSVLFPIYNFFNIAGKLGTPTFIMLSSFVLFYNYYPRKIDTGLIKRFYVKRLKFILIPYVLFSAIYFVIKMYVYYDYPSISYAIQRFLFLLALGKAHTHLYFVFISVQFYLLFPLLLLAFKQFSFLRKYAVLIGLMAQWVWVVLNDVYFHIPWKGSVSFSYLSFYFIGAYLGIYYTDIKNKFKRPLFKDRIIILLSVGYGVILILYTGYMYLARTNVFSDVANNLHPLVAKYLGEFTWATHALFAGLLLFYIAHIANKSVKPRVKLFLMEIGATSFGIYLIHPLFLMLFRYLVSGGSPIVYNSWQIFSFVCVTFLSWFVVRLVFRLFSHYWLLFGKMEQPHLFFKNMKEEGDERELRKHS